MKKFGVEESAVIQKQAAASDAQVRCPVCGTLAEKHGKVYLCPRHGSRPFESHYEKP